MEVKRFKKDKNIFDRLSDVTNRSVDQTKFLFELVDKDLLKLIELEEKIKKPITLVPTKTWSESLEFGQKRTCDIFSLVMTTPQREKYLNFTKPYL